MISMFCTTEIKDGTTCENREDGEEGAFEDQMFNPSVDNNPEGLLILQEIMDYLKAYDSGLFSDFEHRVLQEKMRGLSYMEIADVLDRSPKSIDNALQRIKKKIVAYIEK